MVAGDAEKDLAVADQILSYEEGDQNYEKGIIILLLCLSTVSLVASLSCHDHFHLPT